jgi:TonB-linked SusC/RagA family outer membrane protein
MRLAAVLLLAACLQVSARAQVISLSERDAALDKVFKKIEQQTGYSFVYRDQLLQKAKKVTIEVKNSTLQKVLELCFKDQPLSYSIIEKTIVVSSKESRLNVAEVSPPVMIHGRVLNESGKALSGVSVMSGQSGKGVSTDVNGEYTIQVEGKGAILFFTYVGMRMEKVPVGDSLQVNTTLKEDQRQLEEMVVTGYGIKENKANQVGSAVRIGAEELQRKPVDRIDRLLEGLVPGYQYQQQDPSTSSARPRYETRIRGEGSFRAAGDPLWIVDGVPLYQGTQTSLIPNMSTSISPLTYLNPNDIESVNVLKDATATTIYGANGANGVVLITTKKGKGRDQVNYSFRAGMNLLSNNKFQVLNGDEYRTLVKEAYANANQPYPFDPAHDVANTDWYDVFFRNGSNSLHDLSFSGGTNKTKYFVSGSYYKEKLTMIANQTDRFTLRMNLDQQVSKRLSVSAKIGGSYNMNKLFTPGDDFYTNRPNLSPYNPDGSFALYDSTVARANPASPAPKFFNSLAEAYQNEDNQSTIAVNGTLGATLELIDGLSFTTTNGIDFYNMREDRYQSSQNWSGRSSSGLLLGYSQRAQNSYIKWISINRLNFTRRFGVHAIDAVLGTEASSDKLTFISATGDTFGYDYLKEISSAPTDRTRGGSGKEEKTYFSVLSRLSYTYDRRYTLTGNYRRDGNSGFGKDVRWANFLSIGGSWTMSNEKFWKSRVIDFAKVKASYGTNGNSRIGSNSQGIYKFDEAYSYNGQPGAVQIRGNNPVFSWETTYMLNTGIDISFWNRLGVSLEVYQNTTKNLIDEIDVTRTTGSTQIFQNLGSMRNTGVELSINSTNIKTTAFEWQTRFNISKNKNKILALYNDNNVVKAENFQSVGQDANTLFLVRWAGVDPRDGSPMWYDAKGNITKEYNVNDRVAAGSSTPDFYGGITNSFSYKGFTLYALVNYSVGGYAFSSLRRNSEADGYLIESGNQSRNLLDRWREPGDIALTPKLLAGSSTSSSRNSTRFVHTKTNIRLSNVSLNYQLPTAVLQKIKMSNISAYVQVDNLGIWTPYDNNTNRNTYRNSFSTYPMTRTVSFGIMAGF